MSEVPAAPPATIPEQQQSKPKHEGRAMIQATSFQHTMEPRNFAEMKELAQLLANSDLVPKDCQRKPANVLIILMFGRELGLTTAQALQNTMVVNGRPAIWGDAAQAKVEQSKLLEWWKDALDEKTMTATYIVKRVGRDPVTRTFSQADAQKAGLWTKAGPWTQYPKVMLFNRARAFALRHTFPDVLKGLRIVEEDRDIIEVVEQGDGSYAMPHEKKAAGQDPFAAPPEKTPDQGQAAPVANVPAAAPPKPEAPAGATTAAVETPAPSKELPTKPAPENDRSAPTVTFEVARAAQTTLGNQPVVVVTTTGGKKLYADWEGALAYFQAAAKSKHRLVGDIESVNGNDWLAEVRTEEKQ